MLWVFVFQGCIYVDAHVRVLLVEIKWAISVETLCVTKTQKTPTAGKVLLPRHSHKTPHLSHFLFRQQSFLELFR